MNTVKWRKRVMALALCVGALPFVFGASAYAEENNGNGKNRWLDDYAAPVGLTYNAQAKIQAAYMWRGLYSGGPNLQASANVGYGGLYLDMWWNIGVTDWTFKTFQPEVDFSLGFARWGLDVYLLYVYNFNCGFFDLSNYPDKGNRMELNVRYTLSSKIPLSIRWGTRVAAADSYTVERLTEQGQTLIDTVRAYSSYAEISYTQKLPYGLSLYGAVGITPWKSAYTRYQRNFAVQNLELRLTKDWSLSEHCGMMLQGQLCINPSALAADRTTAQWLPKTPGSQTVNANVTLGIYLK